MKKNILILAAIMVIIMVSCQTEDIDPGAAKNNALSGEWFVEYNHEVFGHDPLGVGYTRLLTSTTASESADELIITDEENVREFRVKAKMDLASKTFGSPDSLVDYIHGIKVVVTNGKIIENAVTTAAGVVTDSIYFDLFLRDLNTTLNVSGYRRTGFLEDEH